MSLRTNLFLSVIMQTSHEKYQCHIFISLKIVSYWYEGHVYNIFFPLNIGSFAVLKSFENIPKHSWNARKSQGDLPKSSEELGIFGGFRLSQFVSGLTADHYFWCSWLFRGCSGVLWDVPGVFRGCSGVFRGVPRCSGGVPGMFRGVPGVFRAVPGCSGLFRAVPGFTDTR